MAIGATNAFMLWSPAAPSFLERLIALEHKIRGSSHLVFLNGEKDSPRVVFSLLGRDRPKMHEPIMFFKIYYF